jgi:hypothetical protein
MSVRRQKNTQLFLSSPATGCTTTAGATIAPNATSSAHTSARASASAAPEPRSTFSSSVS